MSKKNLSSLKVSELRELCKRRDLKSSGRKAELIKRLSETNVESATTLDSSRLKSCMGPLVFKEFHIPSKMALLGYGC